MSKNFVIKQKARFEREISCLTENELRTVPWYFSGEGESPWPGYRVPYPVSCLICRESRGDAPLGGRLL